MHTVLLSPGSVRGFLSAVDPAALPEGYLSHIGNARISQGGLKARDGDETINASIAAGSVRGCFQCSLDGTPYIFVAIGNSSKVTIWRSGDHGANWTEITATSGIFGDTRLTDSTTVPVRFCVVTDRPNTGTAYDCLVIQNGIDSPRIYANGVLSVLTTPERVPDDANLQLLTAFDNSLDVGNSSGTTFNNSDTDFALDDAAASTEANYLELDIATTVTSSMTAQVVFSVDADFSESKQLILIGSNEDDADFFRNLSVTLGDGSGSVTIYNKATGVGSMTQIALNPGDGANARQIAYTLPRNASVDWSAIDRVTFTYTGTAPGSAQVAYIYLLAAGGKTQGGANFAVSYGSSHTKAEGPATFITSRTEGDLSVGGGPDTTAPVPYKIAEDPRFYYDYRVGFSNTTEAQRDAGINVANLYRNDFGTVGYYFVSQDTIATWNGAAWQYSGGSERSLRSFSVTNAVQDQSTQAPDANTLQTPTGTAMAMAASRFFVASGSRLYYSESDKPFRFRKAVRFSELGFEDDSPGSFSLDGEKIQAIVPLGSLSGAAESLNSPIKGAATIHVLTDFNLYGLSGFSALSLNKAIPLAPYGTLSPLSVARSQFGFYYLSQRGQVMFYNGQIANLSQDAVDDKTTVIPNARKAWASGAVKDDRYHLAYTPSGSDNTKVLVWSERLQAWESEDTFSGFDPNFLLPYYSASTGKIGLLVFDTTTNAGVFEYGKPSDTSDVSLSLTFGEFTAEYLSTLVATQMGVMASKGSGNTLTIATSRTFKNPTDTTTNPTTGSIAVSGSGTLVWHYDAEGVGGEGATVKPGISGTVPGGTNLYSVFIDIEKGQMGVQR